MTQIDTVFIISLIAVAVAGFFVGFGKSLKITTKGIFGIIISIIVCVLMGGTIKSINAVGGFIENADEYFTGLWDFLGKLYFGTVVYYVCFFIIVQIIRIAIVKTIGKIDDIGNRGVKMVNKVFGAAFLPSFCFALLLLFLAGLKLFESTDFAVNLLAKIDDTFLMTLYINNPIVL